MKKIVLIEDSLNLRETTKEILELSGYRVFTSGNGKKGIEMAISEKPDIILCDVGMSNMDGYSVLSILSKNPETYTIPFIFLTADRNLRKGMNFGADDYIIKPFKESELIEAIETRLKKSEKFKISTPNNMNDLNTLLYNDKGLNELNELTKNRKINRYKKKEIIFREGDYANYLYFILTGKIKCVKTDEFGKEFICDLHTEGGFLGYIAVLEDGEYCETAISTEVTEVVKIPKMDFIELIQKNRDVAMKFIKILSEGLKDRDERLLKLAYTPVRERVAERILTLENNYVSVNKSTMILEISRGDLASMVGTAKETLNRMISELKNEGLLDTHRQEIKILNKSGLQKIANHKINC